MAIPFFGNDDNNNERSPADDQQLKLILDLYISLQNVIRQRHAQHTAARNHRVQRQLAEQSAGQSAASSYAVDEYASSSYVPLAQPRAQSWAQPRAQPSAEPSARQWDSQSIARQAGGNLPQQVQSPPVVIVVHPGNTEDLAKLSLPELVQSAMEQLPPPPSPRVTVSVPSSPMRDATFQFPECSTSTSANTSSTSISNMSSTVPPTPRPRRRFFSESSIMENSQRAGPSSSSLEVNMCSGNCCHISREADKQLSWSNVGTNLRNIAGDFQNRTEASRIKETIARMNKKSRLPIEPSVETETANPTLPATTNRRPRNSLLDSLLSFFISRTPLRDTLWATMALYLGWELYCLQQR